MVKYRRYVDRHGHSRWEEIRPHIPAKKRWRQIDKKLRPVIEQAKTKRTQEEFLHEVMFWRSRWDPMPPYAIVHGGYKRSSFITVMRCLKRFGHDMKFYEEVCRRYGIHLTTWQEVFDELVDVFEQFKDDLSEADAVMVARAVEYVRERERAALREDVRVVFNVMDRVQELSPKVRPIGVCQRLVDDGGGSVSVDPSSMIGQSRAINGIDDILMPRSTAHRSLNHKFGMPPFRGFNSIIARKA